jgi:hypothetical protein
VALELSVDCLLVPDLTAWTPADWSALALATVTVAIVATCVAVVQVRHARQLGEEQAQPFVVVDLEPSAASSILVDLVIKNTGQTLAENVRITFQPPLVSGYFSQPNLPQKCDITEAAILKQGIPSMPPGKEFRVLFERMPERYTSDLPRSYEVVVRSASRRGEEKPLRYRLDLDIFLAHNTSRFTVSTTPPRRWTRCGERLRDGRHTTTAYAFTG